MQRRAGKRNRPVYSPDYFDPERFEWEDDETSIQSSTGNEQHIPPLKPRDSDATKRSSSAETPSDPSQGSQDASRSGIARPDPKKRKSASTTSSRTPAPTVSTSSLVNNSQPVQSKTSITDKIVDPVFITRRRRSRRNNSPKTTKRATTVVEDLILTEKDSDQSVLHTDSELTDESDLDQDDARKAAREAKMGRWGAFNKDWSQQIEIQKWLAKKGGEGTEFLAQLTKAIEHGDMTIEELEQVLPGSDITKFWWAQKERFETCRDQEVMLVLAHCPQYESGFPVHPEAVPPEQSRSCTECIVSSIARMIDHPVIAWDMRPDCRKQKLVGKEQYTRCMPVNHNEPREYKVCMYLSNLLLTIAEKLYGMTITATLSFSSAANDFVQIIHSPHIRLFEHISTLSKSTARFEKANVLISGLIESGMSDRSFEDLYAIFRDDLGRSPGKEAGRTQIKLPLLKSFEHIENFEKLAGTFSRERMEYRQVLRAQKGQERRDNNPLLTRPYIDLTRERVEDAESNDPVNKDPVALKLLVEEKRRAFQQAEREGSPVEHVNTLREDYNHTRRKWRRLVGEETPDPVRKQYKVEREELAKEATAEELDEEILDARQRTALNAFRKLKSKPGTAAEIRAAQDTYNAARRDMARAKALKKKTARNKAEPDQSDMIDHSMGMDDEDDGTGSHPDGVGSDAEEDDETG
ncbi:hypothetical protein KCU92_g9003, partial [Aureobasidium melanogenum]